MNGKLKRACRLVEDSIFSLGDGGDLSDELDLIADLVACLKNAERFIVIHSRDGTTWAWTTDRSVMSAGHQQVEATILAVRQELERE